MLLTVAHEFMRKMAQPFDRERVGESLLTEEQVNNFVEPALAR